MRVFAFRRGSVAATHRAVTLNDCTSPARIREGSFDLVAPDGRRLVVAAVSEASTIADLHAALAQQGQRDLSRELYVDGVAIDPQLRVHGSGIHHGSLLTYVLPPTATGQPMIEAVWVAGPDAGASVLLAAGSHLIGRAPLASVRCGDPELELHHASLEVLANGTMRLTQLAGCLSVVVDGRPLEGAVHVGAGQCIEIGSSLLELRAVTDDSDAAHADAVCLGRQVAERQASPTNPWRTPFVRSPRQIRTFEPPTVQAPQRERTGSTVATSALIPAALGVAGAVAMALVLGQSTFLLFGLMGAFVAIGTWATQRYSGSRAQAKAGRRYEQAQLKFDAGLREQRIAALSFHRDTTPTLSAALTAMNARHGSLWSVRRSDRDAFTISIGRGDTTVQPRVGGLSDDAAPDVVAAIRTASRIDNVAYPVILEPGSVTAFVGASRVTAGVVRSAVMQLAAASGPADWQLAVVVDNPADWGCLGWLPHSADAVGAPMIVSAHEAGQFVGDLDLDDARPLIVVVDRPSLFSARTSALRRLLASRRDLVVLLLCAAPQDVPAVATRSLFVDEYARGLWRADTRSSAEPAAIHVAAASVAHTLRASAAIAGLIDPEAADETSAIPRAVGLIELLGLNAHDHSLLTEAVASQWTSNGIDPAPCTPLGVAADGVVEIDLASDGPHALIAGTTGAGKSELLRSLVVGLCARLSPDEITFVLVDYKGGATFDACIDLPHVVGVVTDLDERLGERALRSLEAELRRREQLLRNAGATDLSSYRSIRATEPTLERLARLVVVIDEFATLAVQQPSFIGALLGVAQRGRSLGVHLVLATQRPNGVISEDIRANTNLRIALRVQDPADSNDVIGEPSAASLSRALAGRAIMRLGNDEHVMFQTARATGPVVAATGHLTVREYGTVSTAATSTSCVSSNCDGEQPTELSTLVRAISAAATQCGIEAPHRPWLAPLPTLLAAGGIAPGALGIIDDPDRQQQPLLQWSPRDGNLLIAAASGMGSTSALLALVAHSLQHQASAELFVIDAMGDSRLKHLEVVSGCATVVELRDRERLTRLLAMLDCDRASRKSRSARSSADSMVLMVDGIGALRAELESSDLFEQLAQLDALIAEGQSVGIGVVLTTTQPGAVPSGVLSQMAQRWVFHLADPGDASALGLRALTLPEAVPGRFVDVRTRCEAQLVAVDESIFEDPAPRPIRRTYGALGSLPTHLDLAELPATVKSGCDLELLIGMSYSSLQPSVMAVPSGEHLLVVGPYRSGRSATLHTVCSAWQQAHPGGWVASLPPRRSSAREGHVFQSVDAMLAALPACGDALLVIDDAELVNDEHGGLTELVSSRREGVTVAAAARPDALRSAYGHWTNAVRRSRLGLVMAACSDLDGDLLNAVLPRRLPIAARPGLAWMVADGDQQLVQIACAAAPAA